MKIAIVIFMSLAFTSSLSQVACQQALKKNETSEAMESSDSTVSASSEISDMSVETVTMVIAEDDDGVSESKLEVQKVIGVELSQAGRRICADERSLTQFSTEMAVICANGQPTTLFAELIANAQQSGGAVREPLVIKSESINEVSHFIMATSILVDVELEAALLKRTDLNTSDLAQDGVKLKETQVAATPADGFKSLGTYEVREETSVRFGLATIDDKRIITREFVPLTSSSLIAVYSSLKADAPDNANNILFNKISFWIKDGKTTRILTVSQSKVNDRGQAETAEKAARNMVNQVMAHTVKVLTAAPQPAAP